MKKKPTNLDFGTFGNSPASILLAEILSKEENRKLLSKISKMFQNFNYLLAEIEKVNTSVRFGLAALIYESFVSSASNLPTEVKTFTLNVLSTQYKKWLVKNNAQLTKKNRITKNL